MATLFGVDYAWGKPGPAALRAAGAKFVCRYLSNDTGKNLSVSEAKSLSAAGIDIVVVWETTAQRALAGKAAGASDAKAAEAQAKACGMPAGRPIYFAVDWDATEGQQSKINAYLDGAASVLGTARVGIYGGYYPVKRALDGGHATWAWQTLAWSGGQWDSRAHIQQYSNGHRIAGVGCDYNHAIKADYGQWRIGVTPTPAPTPKPAPEDDMGTFLNIDRSPSAAKLHCPAGKETWLRFDRQWAPSVKDHKRGGDWAVIVGDSSHGYWMHGTTYVHLSAAVSCLVRTVQVDDTKYAITEGNPTVRVTADQFEFGVAAGVAKNHHRYVGITPASDVDVAYCAFMGFYQVQ